MFKAAKINDLISKHPMDGIRFTKPVRATNDITFLARDEQRVFLETEQHSHNYNQFALFLEAGLRTGEMIGLTWDAIDFEKRTLTGNKTLEFRHSQQHWRAGPPKTQHSYRTIPLTGRAYESLKEMRDSRGERKRISDVKSDSGIHEHTDSLDQAVKQFQINGVFLIKTNVVSCTNGVKMV